MCKPNVKIKFIIVLFNRSSFNVCARNVLQLKFSVYSLFNTSICLLKFGSNLLLRCFGSIKTCFGVQQHLRKNKERKKEREKNKREKERNKERKIETNK